MFGQNRSTQGKHELTHENELLLLLGQALWGSISANMRAISLEVIPGGARLHFLLQEDDAWDRWEIEQEIVPNFGAQFAGRMPRTETAVVISPDAHRTTLPGRLAYMRREWWVQGASMHSLIDEMLPGDPPFRPFRLVMADGRSYDVRRSEGAKPSPDKLLIETAPTPDGGPPGVTILSLDQIAAIEPLGPASWYNSSRSSGVPSGAETSSMSADEGATAMSVAETKQHREAIGRIGVDLLDSKIYPTLNPADEGKFVVVDTVSGEYEVDRNDLAALDRLYQRFPEAQPFLGRFGYSSAYFLRSPL